MYVDLNSYKANLADDSPELTGILIALREHPEAEGYFDPIGRLLICSEDVNGIVDRFDIGHDDMGRTYVMPYVTECDVRIQSDPPVIYVGYLNQTGFGEIPNEGLEEQLEEHDLPREMIREIRSYFKSRAPVNWNLEDQ